MKVNRTRAYQARYTDKQGRVWVTLLPLGVPEEHAEEGAPYGPPPLDDLGLPLEVEIRLHNALVERGVLTPDDARLKPTELQSAIQSALRLTVQQLQTLYV